MKIAIAQKIGMTQILTDEGQFKAVTVLRVLPSKLAKIDSEKTGYAGVKLTVDKKNNPASKHKNLIKEFRASKEECENVDAKIDINASLFELNDKVKVESTSKGKGFAGTIKRHNFSRGPMTHGSHNKRRSGSIGAMYPQHVFKGMKMAGRMGGAKTTIKGQKIAFIDTDKNLIAINGSVAGPRKSIVRVIGY